MREATRVVRSGLTAAVAGEAMQLGPVFAGPFHTPGHPAGVRYTYGGSGNPTWTALEEAIAAIEGAGCAGVRVFGSGTAATAAVFGAVLRPGDVLVLPEEAYFGTRRVVEEYFGPMGVRVRTAATRGSAQAEAVEGAKLVWVETPSNPGMEVCDVALICERAHAAGALVAVDNTMATPMGQKVMEMGADFAVVSDAKLMLGHGDVVLGHVAARDVEWLDVLTAWRNRTGAVVGPMEAWLALRSLPTLPLRMERSSANAMRIAEFLLDRTEVERVLYPGLPGHPGYEIAARQMRWFGPLLSFVLRDRGMAERFLATAALVTEATSFGGVTTTAERRGRWGLDAVPEGLIRLSAGCEDADDLIEDIGRALAVAAR